MAQGIKIPIETKNGRMVRLGGDDYIQQTVISALGSGESENPFQSMSLGEFMIFDINDATSEGDIRTKIISIFESFEKSQLAKLDSKSDNMTFRSKGSEMFVDVAYVNIETQERKEFEVPLPNG